MTKGLRDAGVDVVEMGFLRSGVDYRGNSTFFSEIDQFAAFIPENRGNTMYVAFCDYGKEFHMWDFSKLPPCDGSTVTGIRLGFRKKDIYAAIPTAKWIKKQGYTLFVQGVESLNYSDKELLELIDIINDIQPHSFGIVDTYGAMYSDDVMHLYNLVDHNLDKNIAIDFHSHNNMMMSFAFAQMIVVASNGVRPIYLDATLEGMGKGTGNLNTELIMDYLIRKRGYSYNIDVLFDTIDGYLHAIKEKHSWHYQIPYYFAGVYSSHANNIIYLQDKHRLNTKDIKNILMMMDPESRKRYNYDSIEKLYIDYCSTKVDDAAARETLEAAFHGKPVLILVPGYSLAAEKEKIEAFIEQKKPAVIAVNFEPRLNCGSDLYLFYGNKRKYENRPRDTEGTTILCSNVAPDAAVQNAFVVNYRDLVQMVPGVKYFDNSTVMLLNLLNQLFVKQMFIAGFDGFDANVKSNFCREDLDDERFEKDYDVINKDVALLLERFADALSDDVTVSFITESRFAHVFLRRRGNESEQ